MTQTRRIFHVLLMVALVLANASPACAFMSGKMMEICQADGSIVQVSMPDEMQELASFMPGVQDETPDAPIDHAQDAVDCAFCMTQCHVPLSFTHASDLQFYGFAGADDHTVSTFTFDGFLTAGFQARAPPSYLS